MSCTGVNSPTICVLPFSHTMIHSNGDIIPCCAVDRAYDANGKVFNVKTHKISEFWNSDFQKQLRLDLIAGKAPESCNECWKLENSDHTKGSSARLNNQTRIPLERVKDRIAYAEDNGGELNVDWFDMQISTGNLCNLSCKMCGPVNSTMFSSFFLDRGFTNREISFSKSSKGLYIGGELGELHDWPVHYPLSTILKDHYESLTCIWLTGGEPTIIKENLEFLEDLVATGHSQHILAFINTNCTTINKRLLDVLTHFQGVMFQLSIDAIDEIAYIQRTPSRWPFIEKNIDDIFYWLVEQNNVHQNSVCFNSVVTNLNFHQVPTMWKHLITRYHKYHDQVYTGFGFSPVVAADINFGFSIVPSRVRDQVKLELDELRLMPEVMVSHELLGNIEKFTHYLDTIDYPDSNEEMHFMLDRLQKVHPELNIKEIYSIYYT